MSCDNMDMIVKLATILSPIIAIGLAVWVNYASRKDTKKQINAIKRLSVLQAEITIIQNEIELFKSNIKLQQAKELEFDDNGIAAYQMDAWRLQQMHNVNKKSHFDKDYYLKLQVKLQEKQNELIKLKKELVQL